MCLQNKNYPTYMTPLKMTLLECAKDAFGDTSPKMEDIYANSRGVIERSRML